MGFNYGSVFLSNFLNGPNAAARVAFVDPGTRGPRDPWTPGQVG